MNLRDLKVNFIIAINSFFPSNNNAEVVASKLSEHAFSEFEYRRATTLSKDFEPHLDEIKGKDILDVGCGLGGFPAFYAEEKGTHSVTTLDLSQTHLEAAKSFIENRITGGWVNFVNCNATKLPFNDETFDAVVSTNTFEHIFDITGALRECLRVVKVGGQVLISFPPYRSPWGPHLNNWIRIPWCSVLFSESALIAACNRLEAKEKVNARFPPSLRLELAGAARLTHVNKITIAEFETAMAQVQKEYGLKILRAMLLPIGGRYKNNLPSRLFAPLTKMHVIRDMFTTQAVYVLER